MNEIISFSISNELRRKIDAIRGDIPRSKFIARLIEAMISDEKETRLSYYIALMNLNPTARARDARENLSNILELDILERLVISVKHALMIY
jgi:metal-responsive CopG/Arc/MetJ family transcriptional regulator